MKGQLNRNHFILGYTDSETVMLDLDNTTFKDAKFLANRTMKWYKLGGFIILRSSENNYHVVFNRPVDWSENMRIVASACLISHNRMLEKWFLMQCIKQEVTLRLGPKGDKASPKIVYRYGKEDGQISEFLRYRNIIKDIMRRLKFD